VYFENHDQPRFISRFCDSKEYRAEASKMVAGLLLTLRGTPFIFEGQEIGMTNGDFKDLSEVEDIESHNIYAMAKSLGLPKSYRWKMIQRTSRDNARTPMQWTPGERAGFSSSEPWLKINANHTEVNVESEQMQKNGVLEFWKRMVLIRKENEILKNGDFASVYEGKSVYAYQREYNGKRLISIMNMCSKNVKIPSSIAIGGKVIISNYDGECANLRPFEFRLIALD
jgi:oligo-1,6-glucosidase